MHNWYKEYDSVIRSICPNYELALNKLVGEITNANIIELGCGTGNLTEKLLKKGNKVRAYDTDSFMLGVARDKFVKQKKIELVKGNALNVIYDPEKVVVSSLLFHLLDKKDRKVIFMKISKVGADLYIFDRIRGETDEEEIMYQKNFRKNLKDIPTKKITKLVVENKSNKPDKLSEQREYFESKGYTFRIIFQDSTQGFVAYCFSKNNPQ